MRGADPLFKVDTTLLTYSARGSGRAHFCLTAARRPDRSTLFSVD
jgi:hypothetical protein